MTMARLFKGHLQGYFSSCHKNFEAIVLEGGDLWHWWHDNSAPGNPWKRGQRIIENLAAFPRSMIQRSLFHYSGLIRSASDESAGRARQDGSEPSSISTANIALGGRWHADDLALAVGIRQRRLSPRPRRSARRLIRPWCTGLSRSGR